VFRRVLVANRGVAACRILRTLGRMGIGSVAVYSEADRHALHVAAADQARCIGPSVASESYLRIDRVLQAARDAGADAVHPGYGFLAENAEFAQACADADLTFVGPTPSQIRDFGPKHRAREVARAAGVRLAPGSGLLPDLDAARREAAAIGYPVMLKSTAGGRGIGLLLCETDDALAAAFGRAAQQASSAFGNPGLFVERAIARGHYVEVQIFGDGRGRVEVLGDRDCSAQRRHRKVIEETPAPNLPDAVRQGLHAAARRLGEAVSYANAGTVEFIYDMEAGTAYFLEVNTRLQVEHGVTEAVLGIDLVEWMLRQAAGEGIPPLPPAPALGHAFRPAAGRLSRVCFPEVARIDACIVDGTEVPPSRRAEPGGALDDADPLAAGEPDALAPGHEAVPSPVAGTVWKLLATGSPQASHCSCWKR
jgi:urea carboxylase